MRKVGNGEKSKGKWGKRGKSINRKRRSGTGVEGERGEKENRGKEEKVKAKGEGEWRNGPSGVRQGPHEAHHQQLPACWRVAVGGR